jgi:hypothetical protein
MADDIPFDRNLDLAADTVDESIPGTRRMVANNPGGAMSYIVGRGTVAIVDPGPNDPAHIGALLDAVRNETVGRSSSPKPTATTRRRGRW